VKKISNRKTKKYTNNVVSPEEYRKMKTVKKQARRK
jgi:hypothetical protein